MSRRKSRKGIPNKRAAEIARVTPRARPVDVAVRMAERDARYAADRRTLAEKWLGDPAPGQSALAQRAGR